jgi:hypothetical protein
VISVRRPLNEELSGLILHCLMAAIVGTLVFVICTMAVDRAFSFAGGRAPDLGLLFNPLIWFPAGLLGVVANRLMQHRSACLVGVVGALFMFAMMAFQVFLYQRSEYFSNLAQGHYWRYELLQLFSSDARICAQGGCLGRFYTIPFLSSIAYSIGAWLGLKSRIAEHTLTTPPVA